MTGATGRNLALAVVIGAYMLSFFHRFAPAGVAEDLAAAFSTTAASLGVLAATYFYVYALVQIPTGILVDTVGPRRTLLGGGLLAAAGSALFALAPDLTVAMIGRTVTGLGVAVVFVAMLKLIALWYPENRFASMVGLAMLLGNAGSMLAGTPLAALSAATSWRTAFLATAAISLALVVATWFLVREAPREGRTRFDRTAILEGLLTVLKNRLTWPAVFVNFGLCGSFFAFGGLWATPWLMSVHELSRIAAANHISLLFAGFACGCLAIGTLSDRVGRRKPVLVATGAACVAIWLVWLSGVRMPLAASLALFALMGVTTAAFTLSWACVKEVNPPHLSGMSTSVVNMGGFVSAAVLQPVVGLIMDHGWDGTTVAGVRQYTPDTFTPALALLTAIAVSGVIAGSLLRETRCRNVWRPA
ncbi:MAG: MFS transporter [Azoarcus sp.]|nr:MFS transporter [Azoarcus sp.]